MSIKPLYYTWHLWSLYFKANWFEILIVCAKSLPRKMFGLILIQTLWEKVYNQGLRNSGAVLIYHSHKSGTKVSAKLCYHLKVRLCVSELTQTLTEFPSLWVHDWGPWVSVGCWVGATPWSQKLLCKPLHRYFITWLFAPWKLVRKFLSLVC